MWRQSKLVWKPGPPQVLSNQQWKERKIQPLLRGMKGLLDTEYVELGAETWSQNMVYLAVSKVAVVHNCSAYYWYRPRNRVDRPKTSHCSFRAQSTTGPLELRRSWVLRIVMAPKRHWRCFSVRLVELINQRFRGRRRRGWCCVRQPLRM